MRIILLIGVLLICLSPEAQTTLPVGSINYGLWQPFPAYNGPGDSMNINQKWYLSKYAGFSTGVSVYNGGSTTFISAPVGLQLNHPLNNNLIAFAGVSVAPTFLNFNSAFTNPGMNKYYPGSYLPNTYTFGMSSKIELGLMYVNDARTFSISGSIGIERNDYPGYYPPIPQNTKNNIRY